VDVKWKPRAESTEGTSGDPCHEEPEEAGYVDSISWRIRGRYEMRLAGVILVTPTRQTPRFLVDGTPRRFIFDGKVRNFRV
jgi:hypothetical protein